MQKQVDVIVSVSDKYLWSLKPFSYLFNKYWSSFQRVIVAGYSLPDFKLPDNFSFYTIAQPQYEKERWADGLMQFFDVYQHPYFVLMLEDYWLSREVDVAGISKLVEYMELHQDVLRMDLTADRLYAGGMRQVDYWKNFDIIEAEQSQYQMSLQCGLWNRELFMKVLKALPKGMHSAWDVELEGTNIINNNYIRVLGTRQWPVRYQNGMNNASGKQVFTSELNPSDASITKLMIPGDYVGD